MLGMEEALSMEKLPRSFYDRDTLTVARALLGKLLVRVQNGVPLVGRITETEAYVGPVDKACHAYLYKRTPRTETLFAPPGTAYIYLIYGMHCCLNFVTEAEGTPCAVLLRAVEPIGDETALARNRFGILPEEFTPYQRKNFLNGPGKVCKAFALDRSLNGADLTGEVLYLAEDGFLPGPIHVGKRVGIDYAEEAKDFLWRFYL